MNNSRKETWEQAHINELEEIPLLIFNTGDLHLSVKYAEWQEKQFRYDKLEQALRINDMLYWDNVEPDEEKRIQ